MTAFSAPLPTTQIDQRGKFPPISLPLQPPLKADFPILDTLDSSDAIIAIREAAEAHTMPARKEVVAGADRPKLPHLRGSVIDWVSEKM